MKVLKPEEALLEFHLRQNEKRGSTPNTGRIDLDAKTLAELNLQMGLHLSQDDLDKVGSICIANQWLKHTVLASSSGRYIQLAFTTQGIGVVKSNRAVIERERNQNRFQKVLLSFNSYQGAIAVLAALLGLMAVIFFGG